MQTTSIVIGTTAEFLVSFLFSVFRLKTPQKRRCGVGSSKKKRVEEIDKVWMSGERREESIFFLRDRCGDDNDHEIFYFCVVFIYSVVRSFDGWYV